MRRSKTMWCGACSKELDADPRTIRAQLEEEAEKGGRTDVTPSLAPDAKRALLAAYDESRALGSSYIGPEHVLLALAADDESEAGRLLGRFGLSHTRLSGAVMRGVEPRARRASRPARPRPSTSTAATSPRWPARASSTRHRPGRRDRADHRDPLPADQEQPRPDRRPRRRQDRHRGGHRPAHRQRRGAGDPGRQAGRAARPRRAGRRHPVPRPVRGAAQEGHRRDHASTPRS